MDERLFSFPCRAFSGFADRDTQRSGFLADSNFRFGSLRACLRTDDAEFKARFLRIFSDCLEPPDAGSGVPPVILEVSALCSPDQILAEISRHENVADSAALSLIFPELQRIPSQQNTAAEWQLFSRGSDPRPVVAIRGNQLVFDRESPWQITIAHYFLNHVMRLQPEMFFFHGATVAMRDRGVLLSGPKGAGKSTLSLALAARGHGFLGDEIATIDSRTGQVLPFRRSVSIRLGPQAQAVQRYLRHNQVDQETLPDGTSRSRMPASQLFPDAKPRPVPLTHAFFLAGIASKPQVTAFEFAWKDLPLLSPLHATVAGIPAGERTLRFLNLFNGVRCYILVPGGTPDETAELIDNVVEDRWDTASKKKPSASAPFAG